MGVVFVKHYTNTTPISTPNSNSDTLYGQYGCNASVVLVQWWCSVGVVLRQHYTHITL